MQNVTDGEGEVSVLVDYYAFSSPLEASETLEAGFLIPEICARHVRRVLGLEIARALVPLSDGWKPARGFAPGARGYIASGDKRRVAYRDADSLCMFDLPGQACANLARAGVLNALIAGTAGRASRIDVAIDRRTSDTPAEFVAKYLTISGRASRTSMHSGTGDTEYVGSMKSDRFLRVYRYAEPHPRSDTLRMEFVYRRDYAKSAARAIADGGVLGVAIAALERMECTHSALQFDAEGAAISAPRKHSKTNAGTLRWLQTACAPALARMIKAGEIDFEDFHGWVMREMN